VTSPPGSLGDVRSGQDEIADDCSRARRAELAAVHRLPDSLDKRDLPSDPDALRGVPERSELAAELLAHIRACQFFYIAPACFRIAALRLWANQPSAWRNAGL
jgi:hypothetical protein